MIRDAAGYVFIAAIAAAIFLGRRRGKAAFSAAVASAHLAGVVEGTASALASASSSVAVNVVQSGAGAAARYDGARDNDDDDYRAFILCELRRLDAVRVGSGGDAPGLGVGGMLDGVQHGPNTARGLSGSLVPASFRMREFPSAGDSERVMIDGR